MKKSLLTAAIMLLVSAVSANAQTDDSPQVLVDPTIDIYQKGDVQVKWVMSGINAGWCTPTDASMDMNTGFFRSWEIGWPLMSGIEVTVRNTSHFTVGLGLDWRNFNTAGDRGFFVSDAGTISTCAYPEQSATHKHSRIKVFSLQVPIMYSYSFGHEKAWRASLAGIINFNTSGSIQTQYRTGDIDHITKWRSVGQKPVTFDIMPMITYDKIGIYARYSPMSLMKKETGLEFKPFSVGLIMLW